MSKMILKYLSMVICLILAVTMLAGCGSQNANPQPSSSQAAEQSNATTQPAQTETQDSFKDHLTLSWMIPTQQKTSVTDSAVGKEIIKKFNVDFTMTELPPSDQHPQKLKLLIASGDIPDIVTWVQKDDGNKYGAEGAFLELSSYLDSKLSNVKKLLDSDLLGKYNAFTTDGKIYRCPDWYEVSLPIFDFGYMKGEFDAAGATKLDTWTDVYNALKVLKAKYPDSYPLIARGKEIGQDSVKYLTIQSYTEGIMGYGFVQSGPAYDYKNKNFIFGPAAPGFKEAIEWFKKLYDEKLLDPEYMTTDMNGIKSKLQNKKGFMLMDYVGGLAGVDEVQKLVNNGIYPLELPSADGKNRVLGAQPIKIGERGSVLSSKLSGEKLDRALAILNYLYSDECYDLLYWNPDVTNIDSNGQKTYKDVIYNKDPMAMDTYLPWSLNASFRVDYETVTKSGTPYADYKKNVFMNPDNQSMFVPSLIIPFTTDETQKISNLQKPVIDLYEATIDQFIVGKKPMSQWDAFINDLKAAGGEGLVKIYNDAYSKYFK